MNGQAGELLAWLWFAVKVLSLGAIIYWGISEARRYRKTTLAKGRGAEGEDTWVEEPGAEEETGARSESDSETPPGRE